MSEAVLCECFARDGLQHEPGFVPTATKRALIERFAALGFSRIEATSYSNPKVVPQFADASELLRYCSDGLPAFKAPKRIVLSASLPKNERGKLDRRALAERWTREAGS